MIGYFLPVPRVVVIAFDGVQTLAAAGPAEVFSTASRLRGAPLYDVIAWARAHLEQVDVETFAKHVGVSVRTLHRRCRDTVATTPATLLDKLRVEHARNLLATSDLAVKTLAGRCGFGNPVRMKRAFVRELGMGPREYRVMHASRRPGRGRPGDPGRASVRGDPRQAGGACSRCSIVSAMIWCPRAERG